jgi:hypothetical protein
MSGMFKLIFQLSIVGTTLMSCAHQNKHAEDVVGYSTEINNLEVAEYDLWGSYVDVSREINKLNRIERSLGIIRGDSYIWRIPTIEEMQNLQIHRDFLRIKSTLYWSCEVSDTNRFENLQYNFSNGQILGTYRDIDGLSFFQGSANMRQFARPVRTLDSLERVTTPDI